MKFSAWRHKSFVASRRFGAAEAKKKMEAKKRAAGGIIHTPNAPRNCERAAARSTEHFPRQGGASSNMPRRQPRTTAHIRTCTGAHARSTALKRAVLGTPSYALALGICLVPKEFQTHPQSARQCARHVPAFATFPARS